MKAIAQREIVRAASGGRRLVTMVVAVAAVAPILSEQGTGKSHGQHRT